MAEPTAKEVLDDALEGAIRRAFRAGFATSLVGFNAELEPTADEAGRLKDAEDAAVADIMAPVRD